MLEVHVGDSEQEEDATMLKLLQHFDQARARPVWWLLEELGVPYKIGRKTGASGSLDGPDTGEKKQEDDSGVYAMIARSVAASLSGALPPKNLPTLRDGETLVRESGAIVEYLIQKHGKGRFTPKDAQGQLDNTFFLHFAEGSFMPPLVLKLVFSTLKEQAPFFVRPFISIVAGQIQSSFIDPILRTNFEIVDQCLTKHGDRTFLAGGSEPTGGDFMMSHPIDMAISSGAFKDGEIPSSMSQYLSRIQIREAYRAAAQKSQQQPEQAEAPPVVAAPPPQPPAVTRLV